MPKNIRAKTVSKKKSVRVSSKKMVVENVEMPTSFSASSNESTMPKNKFWSPVKIIALAILLGAILLVYRNKGLLIAGTVDNKPIWRWDLEKRLVARRGAQVMDEMVTETLIKSAGAKKNISIAEKEIDSRVKEIEKSLNGQISLKDALSQQGMTLEELRRQIGLQLIVEKLTADSAKVSQEEIDKYLETNRSYLTATDEAGLREEAKQNLIREKQSTAFQQLFEELKKTVKVVNYL